MGEGIDRMKEWFGRALGAADFDLRLHDKEKGSSWKEATPLSLFNQMMGHVNKMMDPNSGIGQIHSIKVVNYALMIATRIAGDIAPVEAEPTPVYGIEGEMELTKEGAEAFAEVLAKTTEQPVEAEPKKNVIREIIHPYSSHTESNVEFGPPIIAGEDESIVAKGLKDIGKALAPEIKKALKDATEASEGKASQWAKIEAEKAFEAAMERKAEPDPLVETGRPPLDLGPLPNRPAEPKDASYYCPWCEHTSTLGEACRGKVCCVKCGKPINSRFAQMLAAARRYNHIILKEPITSATMAKYLGTSPSWAGKILKEVGWEPTRWRGVIWWRWNPPKED